jgi:hypothetical protein
VADYGLTLGHLIGIESFRFLRFSERVLMPKDFHSGWQFGNISPENAVTDGAAIRRVGYRMGIES